MGKSTKSGAMFNSYVKLPEGIKLPNLNESPEYSKSGDGEVT